MRPTRTGLPGNDLRRRPGCWRRSSYSLVLRGLLTFHRKGPVMPLSVWKCAGPGPEGTVVAEWEESAILG